MPTDWFLPKGGWNHPHKALEPSSTVRAAPLRFSLTGWGCPHAEAKKFFEPLLKFSRGGADIPTGTKSVETT